LNLKKRYYRIVASTLNKGRAYDSKINPTSQAERWGFFIYDIYILIVVVNGSDTGKI